MKTRLTLISHATTDALRRAAFPLDEPLAERETEKIARLGWRAPKVQRIWAGPERRAVQTAAALGLPAVTKAELRDCDYGVWGGREVHEVQSLDPGGIAAWLTDPVAAPHGGESIVNLVDRTGRWLKEQSDTAGHAIVVTHPSVIRSAIVHALSAPIAAFWRIDVTPLSLTDLRFNGRVWTLRSVSCSLYSSTREAVDEQ